MAPCSTSALKDTVGAHLLVGFNGTCADGELKRMIKEFRIGGIVLFRRNIEGPDQLRCLLKEARQFARQELGRDLWITIDQEGGPVQRLNPHFMELPSARELSLQGLEAVEIWSDRSARLLKGLGIQINLAPVLDVIPQDETHFMVNRSLGEDPTLVAKLGRQWIRTFQKNGISATAKHYPGLGKAESDPHHYAPVIRWQDDEALKRDMFPFLEAVSAGVHCIMTSHALYPHLDTEWPATLSPEISNQWLRNQLGFQGILMSDDLDMAAVAQRWSWDVMASQGLHTSIDFFLLCQNSENIGPFFDALHLAVQRDSLSRDMHLQSLARIEWLYHFHRAAYTFEK